MSDEASTGPTNEKTEKDYAPLGRPDVPLWRLRWFQVSLGVIVLLTVASYVVPTVFGLIYATRSVLTPVLVGIALAYVLNPVVTWLYERAKVPRPVTAGAMLASLGLAVLGLLVLVPVMLIQALELVQKVPSTIHELAGRDDLPGLVTPVVRWLSATLKQFDDAAHAFLDSTLREPSTEDPAANVAADVADSGSAGTLPQPLPEGGEASAEAVEVVETAGSVLESITGSLGQVNWRAVAEGSSTALDLGAGAVGSVFGWVGYASVFLIVVAFVFFFTTWKFRDFVHAFDPYVPASKKQRTYEVLGMMDRSVSAFIRGRLIQASIMAVVLTVGLLFTDARSFALLLGVAGGVLGLVPYVGLAVWPATVVVACVANLQDGGQIDLLGAVILPSVVFVVAQSVDAYVVEPIVQGKATNLDALTVLLVVLVGGSLAGLLGLLIAIPAAACLKILWREVVAPELKVLAKQA